MKDSGYDSVELKYNRKYIWEMKDKHNETPTLKWSIIKSVPAYSNISKKCALCLQEKFEIINYENQSELHNKR